MYSSGNSHLPKLLYLVLRPSSKNNSYEKFFFHSRNSQNISIDASRTMLCSTLSIQKCRSKNVGQKTSIRKHRSENVDPKTSVQKHWYENGDSKTSVQKCRYENVDPKKSIRKCRYKKRRHLSERTTPLQKRCHLLFDSNERRSYKIFMTTSMKQTPSFTKNIETNAFLYEIYTKRRSYRRAHEHRPSIFSAVPRSRDKFSLRSKKDI